MRREGVHEGLGLDPVRYKIGRKWGYGSGWFIQTVSLMMNVLQYLSALGRIPFELLLSTKNHRGCYR